MQGPEEHEQRTEAGAGGLEGQVLAQKYQLLRLLGQGGMGAVYEGKNLSTLKRCAVKLLNSPELAGNANIVKRFFREARASSVVESDHIVQIFDSGTDPETRVPYMVMELLQGEDLEGTFERLGAVHPVAVTKLVLQAATGLAKAHDAGIVHRDIKPANLFLTQRDSGELVVKLLDFGIAKVKMEQFHETSHGLTRTGALLGTPLFMSPEQATGASNIDARSDVWSLGVVMYQLLSGQMPFEQVKSLGELMVSIITADIPLIQDKAPWVPAELAGIVHRAMSRDISRRFATAGELRDALAALVSDGPRLTPDALVSVPAEYRAQAAPKLQLTDDGMLHAITRAGMSVTQSGQPEKRSKRRAFVAVLLAVPVVAGLVLIGWNVTRSRSLAASAAVMPTSAAVPETTVSALAEPTRVESYTLELAPDGVEVSVDGQPQPVVDHGVVLSGAPGATHRVKLTLKHDSIEETVAVTSTGLVPKRLELTPKASAGPRNTPPDKSAKAAPKAAPDAGAAPKPSEKKTPEVARDLGEFGN